MSGRPGLGREDGRRLFGLDPEAYASGRPGYPARVYEILSMRCGLEPGVPTLEIGPGAGQATAELVERGASPLVAVEPDPRFAAFLALRFGDAVDVRLSTLEDAELAPARFRLATAASSWHWVDQAPGLAAVAQALAPGGWWAVWWSVFHDPDKPDELHRALHPLLGALSAHVLPGRDGSTSGFVLDRDARLADIAGTGAFEDPHVEQIRWPLELDPASTRALFATYSPILALDAAERQRVLTEIERIVTEELGGHVERHCLTVVYTARRRW